MLDKTLEQLDGERWDEPKFQSHTVINCHRLRRVPLKDFTVEDLRLVIGQKLSLEYLIPLALERLEHAPMVSGDYYEGDLLEAVGRPPPEFWEKHPDLVKRYQNINQGICG